MVIMAVDFGYSRTGIAVCDKLEMLASPVTVIFEKEFDKTLEKTAEQAAKLKPGIIVVGLPKRTDGRPGETEEKAKEFAARLGELTGTEIVMWDERFTTVSAHSILDQTNVHGKKRKNVVDSVAAVLILEGYMNYRKNHSV